MNDNTPDDIRQISQRHEKDPEKEGGTHEFLKPTVESSEVLANHFLVLVKDTLILPPSYTRRYDYFKLETHGLRAVSVIARIKDSNKYVIQKEYRHPTKEFLLGLPGGIIDDGETIQVAAQRELLEESGYTNPDIAQFHVLGSCYPWPAVTDLRMYFVAVHDVVFERQPELEPSENLVCMEFSRNELVRELALQKDQCLVDGSLTTAWLYYMLYEQNSTK